MSSNKVDLKVVLLGMSAVGKTSLLERFIHERFSPKYKATVGSAYGDKTMRSNCLDRDVLVGVWDTAGSERYSSVSHMYYRGSKAAIICYDVLSVDSVDKIKFWVNELKSYGEPYLFYICGCKKDTLTNDPEQARVDFDQIKNYSKGINAKHFTTSSKTGEGVRELFQAVVDDVTAHPSFSIDSAPTSTVITLNNTTKKSSRCPLSCK